MSLIGSRRLKKIKQTAPMSVPARQKLMRAKKQTRTKSMKCRMLLAAIGLR